MAATRRSLGGGRVLGTGKGMVAAATAPSPVQPQNNKTGVVRNSGLLSPSASSVSLSSQTSSTPLSTENHNEDIASRVALAGQAPGSAVAAAEGLKMVCPICSEEMVTLLQLNRHIDDNHANLEEIEQEQAKNWFEQQMKKAKKFQPLQLLNQKLRGLEVFESNYDVGRQSGSAAPTPPLHDSRGASPAPALALASTYPPPPALASPDPEDIITRAHWQRPTGHDACSDPLCGKRLGPANGQINCRHCGKLFCEEHTMYQMKLSRSAHHEPVRGMWYRVCETCYKTREGYNDHDGLERSHWDFFRERRRKVVEKVSLETSRLETRLTRLTQLLADPPPASATPKASTDSSPGWGWSAWSGVSGLIAGDREKTRQLEQSVVAWEEDASVLECPFCQQVFSQYALRRHHCRTCGRVVCGDPATECSAEVGLDVARKTESGTPTQAPKTTPLNIRICKSCHRTIFSKSDFARSLTQLPPDARAHSHLLQFESGIRLLLPKFQRLLSTFQDPDNPPSPAQLAEAAKVRKRLTEAFTQYDVAARRIRDLPAKEGSAAERLQKAVYARAAAFLHANMLGLKSVPKILGAQPGRKGAEGRNGVAAVNGNALQRGGSVSSRASSSAVTALEAEEKELRERLAVLEEQRFMVEAMVADANKRRKFDEAASLAGNVEDLRREIEGVRGALGGLDFEGVYAGAAEGVVK